MTKEKELELLKIEIEELKSALQQVLGHHNCYCGNCKAVSHRYYRRKEK